jgi:RNA polymerase sigma-70 factor (ECF subfamily)
VNGQPHADRQLVDAVIAGDHGAFRTLVDRESPAVIAVCRRVLREPSEAEDAAQDVFLQAYRSLASFRGDGPIGAWLRRIAVRAAVARLGARTDLGPGDADASDAEAARLVGSDDPERELLASEWRAAILDAVRALPEAQREVILLRFYRDLSLDEIATLTRRPVGTVKSRLRRGLAGLRDQIAPGTTP